MLTRDKREALLGVADRLSLDLGFEGDGELGDEPALPAELGARGQVLDAEDEFLVASLRRALGRLAAAVGGDAATKNRSIAVATALDGTELVMRGALLTGDDARLPERFPGFVFLVTLQVTGQDTALELSRRAGRLVERALEG